MLAYVSFAEGTDHSTVSIVLSGKAQPVEVYDPSPGLPPRSFQIVLTSGDVGWFGLPVTIAQHLSALGYRVIGFNARAYLSSFTGDQFVLKPDQISADYRKLLDWAAQAKGFPPSIAMIGVSEGAGLEVVGAGQAPLTPFCRGIISLGLPAKTTLGWRWTDFPMWVTKKNPREPLADTAPFLQRLKIPVVMIHSTHDEWDSIDTARSMFRLAPEPKRFIAIDAVNHRFSDKVPEVMSKIDASLIWLENPAAPQSPVALRSQ